MVVSSKEPGSDSSRESWGPRFTYVYLTKCIIKSFHRIHWDKTMVSISRAVQKTSGSLKLKLGPKAKPEEVLEVLPREAELIKSLCGLLSPSHLLLFPAPRHKASHVWLGDILIWMQQIPAGPVLPRQDLLLGLFWLEYGGFSIKKQALIFHYSHSKSASASPECWLEMQNLGALGWHSG